MTETGGPVTAPRHHAADEVTTGLTLPTLAITMDAGDLRWFSRHRGTARWFPISLRTESKTVPGWIGYRGRYSRTFGKPSFEIFLNELLNGHRRLHLNAGDRDPSLLRGRLSMELFANLGVPSPQGCHVSLVLNGEPRGVYTAYEAMDEAWFSRCGLTPGAIYYAVGTKGNFGLLDPDTGRRKRWVAAGYEKVCPDDDDFSDLEDLIYGIALPDAEQFDSEIDKRIDVERCLRWFVGVEFTSHTDGLVQNYGLVRSGSGRWQISPWDCDGTLGRTPRGTTLRSSEVDIGSGEDNMLVQRLLRSPHWRRRYLAIWEEALATVLSARRIATRMYEMHEEIRRAALADASRGFSRSTFLREPSRIKTYIEDRTTFVQRRLKLLRERWCS